MKVNGQRAVTLKIVMRLRDGRTVTETRKLKACRAR